MPSEIDPPGIGTFTMKCLLMLSRIDSVLSSNTTTNPTKTIHSFLEKEAKTRFICFFEGNLKLRIRI